MKPVLRPIKSVSWEEDQEGVLRGGAIAQKPNVPSFVIHVAGKGGKSGCRMEEVDEGGIVSHKSECNEIVLLHDLPMKRLDNGQRGGGGLLLCWCGSHL